MSKETFESYFTSRDVDKNFYGDYQIPIYLKNILPVNKKAKILDIGCGVGQLLLALKREKYSDVFGVDLSTEAINICVEKELPALLIDNIESYQPTSKFDFIIMSHVLEHIEKDLIINTLKYIKNNLLSENGALFIAVPNAQASVGCYWAYEDFTHKTLFTGGSLSYVLKLAGFKDMTFLDKNCLSGKIWYKKLIFIILQSVYIINLKFWHRVMSNYYHKPSPVIFSWEIKLLAKNFK